MKKRILLLPVIGLVAYVVLSSSASGAGATSGYNATGSETGLGNVTGCYANSSCHASAATAGITLSIELDSAGVVASSTATSGHYKPGYTYSIKIIGTNTTTNTLPKFGFQVSAITGSTAVTTPTNAGTFVTSSLPAGVQYTPANTNFVCNVVEHSTRLNPSSGTGGTGTVYTESFNWTAPAAGTGTVSIWAALNAVNDAPNGADAGDKWNTNKLVLTELSDVSVANVLSNISINAFPNPATTNLNLQLTGAEEGNYSLQVFDLSGRTMTTENLAVSGNHFVTALNTANWAPGMYSVVLSKDGNTKAITVAKQ